MVVKKGGRLSNFICCVCVCVPDDVEDTGWRDNAPPLPPPSSSFVATPGTGPSQGNVTRCRLRGAVSSRGARIKIKEDTQ
ncbi:hypothetical protein LX36DRAFT_41858 [Colletotrichum falcatum]|nr:hypothetical protein LX36DRAFT_41858 [Colletotrichum falcatum]